ncbi:MAG: endolytic transglycosylase MltG, partial [Gammaproteobacteria bacterium]|nr:endolytic transglycosylase MltG [Gammaproteobacteria bacterium]
CIRDSYNTSPRRGLPPTPVSLPGESSLRAAVQPQKTDAYYFVAKGGGRHHFSATLKQHNRAVRKYARKSG